MIMLLPLLNYAELKSNMTDTVIELNDIEEEDSFVPRLLLFNVTNNLEFVLPNRFNKTLVAFLSGAILFVLVNTAFLMTYITPKVLKSKEKANSYKNDQEDNKRADDQDDFNYDDYYDYYYYEDMLNNTSSSSEETPR